ncbi:MAG: hypothetical protein ACFFB5_19820 [Promethearchaeota archaeon]
MITNIGVTTLEFLHPQWLVLVFSFIIICEFLLFLFLWHDLKISFKVAFFGNIGSALIGLLIAPSPLFEYIWKGVMNVGFLFSMQSYHEMINNISLLSMYILLGLLLETIAVEFIIAQLLNAPEIDLLKKITIPNIVTYTTIICLALFIGMSVETSPMENLPLNLYWFINTPDTLWSIIILMYFELIIILIMPVMFVYYIIKELDVLTNIRRIKSRKKTVLSNRHVLRQEKSLD